METILIAIIASHLSEVITWFNHKLTGTVLAGYGAFILVGGISLIGSVVDQVLIAHAFPTISSWKDLMTEWGVIFALSQVYFQFIVKTFKLDVQVPSLG